MKGNRIFRLIAVLLSIAMLAVIFSACGSSGNENNETDPTNNAEAMVTASPDGAVTQSPTQAADATGDPTATGSASSTDAAATQANGGVDTTPGASEPGTTAQAGSTDRPGNTGAAASQNPVSTIAPVTSETSSPWLTLGPGITQAAATPTAAPRPTATSAAPTPQPTATPLPNNGYVANYAGAVVDQIGLKVGDSFYWTLDLVNEHSRLWSGQWLIDYPESYLKVDNYTSTWTGGITSQVQETWDDGSAWSDIPAIVCNPEYNGNSGGHPLGEAGNKYANIGMYLTSFSYYGVQVSGSLIRLKFTLKSMPADSALKHDSNGYYIEIPVLVCESTAMIDAPADSPVQPYSCVPHGTVTVEPGKVYIKR